MKIICLFYFFALNLVVYSDEIKFGTSWDYDIPYQRRVLNTHGIPKHHVIPQNLIKTWMDSLNVEQKRNLVQTVKQDFERNENNYHVSETFEQDVERDRRGDYGEKLAWNEEKYTDAFYSYFVYHPGFIFLPPDHKPERVDDPKDGFEENFECAFENKRGREYGAYKKIYEEMVTKILFQNY